MNSTHNYIEYSFSNVDNLDMNKCVANNCIESIYNYGDTNEKRDCFINKTKNINSINDSNSSSGIKPLYTGNINVVEIDYVQGMVKNNYEDISVAEKNGIINRNRNSDDVLTIVECGKGGNRNQSRNICLNQNISNLKLCNSLDMSYIYNTYDKNGLLYCKKIKFHIKGDNINDYITTLVVKINTLKNNMGKQYMRLELSDEKNESFFYYLDLFEENYENIKKEQKLVINFNLFPFKFIDLLEECVLENEQCDDIEDQRLNAVFIIENNIKDVSSKGYGRDGYISNYINNHNDNKFSSNTSNEGTYEKGVLNLVEINQFKELTHLSLVLKKADNENIIKYLCNNIKYVKEYSDHLIKKLNEEIINNNNSCIEIKALEKTIENMDMKIKNIKCNFNHTLNNEIQNLKEEHQKIIERKDEMFILEKNELKMDLESLKKKCNEYNELNTNNEENIIHLNNKVNKLINEIKEKNDYLSKLKKEKESIECEKCKLEKDKNYFTIELNNLKTKYEKECENNISNNSSYESIKINNNNLELELKKYKDRNGKLEKEINIAIDEINKGNDIITKLQTQLKKIKDKLKNKTTEYNNLQKNHSQNMIEIAKIQAQLAETQIKLSEKETSEDNLRREVDTLQRKNDELVKDLNISREVNLRLNKEVANNNLDIYSVKMNNIGGTPTISTGSNFQVDTNLLDKDLFTKLKANLKNSSGMGYTPTYTPDSNITNLNLITGKIDALDINDRYNKPVKFIPPGI
ncbi:spindle assembly abnormal protein 6, putative [Plasmodium vinckei brucechwatti]|uniref:Spindle assembly abnormal protein 6, putative n=1 Tax=Plasmodium vinckei brucechwatti TaxID=119398 RepID=A0A6V7RTN6_PLAVN|nr:spindle assembly abnormal protein 6, putative [Plasmodium vinckei brucechwatti]